jgi:inward rectifier potassium channel
MPDEPDAAAQSGAAPDRAPSALRAILRDGRPDIKTIGAERAAFGDIYFSPLHESWSTLLLRFLLGFVLFNLFFATLYSFDPYGLAVQSNEADVLRFSRDFFFSVCPRATIGYGNVYPVTMYTNFVVIEAMTGVLGFALTTGLAFARFARPTAR